MKESRQEKTLWGLRIVAIFLPKFLESLAASCLACFHHKLALVPDSLTTEIAGNLTGFCPFMEYMYA